ncbi:MAG TPA: mannose-1-phosphate guanylyltransferase [Terriglobia bacterium]|nr:mannose-1-phosphate guanylyltransferase [Terriglobia bacterium]
MPKPPARRDTSLEHVYAVIMAGGSGTRFWPLSRRQRPKQLLELFGKGTLLAQTAARIRPLVPPERTYVFTNELLRDAIRRSLPEVPRRQIVAEPAARNTAPSLALAAHEILRRDPDGIMLALPSDHIIRKPARFLKVLRAGCKVASVEGHSVIVGLKPTEANTGYGYVRLGKIKRRLDGSEVYRVAKFIEKPKARAAARYLASGNYLWNGGMFIWRASTLLGNLRRYQPKMARGLERIARAGCATSPATLRKLYPRLEKISIDYALMQKMRSGVYALAADIGWSDVGSWSVVYDLSPKNGKGNVRPARSLCLDARRNMIVAHRKFVVAVGVEDLVIVETEDALLVCARDKSQEVGKAVQELDQQGRSDLL